MTASTSQPGSESSEKRWYCVRTKPKAEHIAAAHLRTLEDVEVFCPRVRYKKATRRGQVWFIEALFPGYVFARFALDEKMRAVTYSQSVTCLVRFGDRYSSLSADVVEGLRREMRDEEVSTISPDIQAGDEVEVTEGPLRGLTALVTRYVPGRERVRILLEFLGEQNEIEVLTSTLLGSRDPKTETWSK